MSSFSARSQTNLTTCHQDLQDVANRAIQFFDFSVVCGHRPEQEQTRVFNARLSKVKWPDSKHNAMPSLAFDIYPWHSKYGSLTDDIAVLDKIKSMSLCTLQQAKQFVHEEYCMMAQAIKIAAQLEGITLRWGGDWDSDTDRLDQTFNDLCHFELVEVR